MEGRLVIPQFNIDARISFLVDTGADNSLIAPADAKEMGIDYTELGKPVESLGMGGIALSHPVRASLAFVDPGKFVYVYHLDALDIAVPDPEIEEMPSLLGREILDRWRVILDPSRNNLSFVVRSADLVLSV
ncbi:MAG: retroviral-like aspartic protease family protein [Chloroflexota bacterium]|nr:retroviral-like aspartic protease family protein [Chloroflexota bacterium]